MMFKVFTFLLKRLWTRKLLLVIKNSRCIRSMIKMLNDWYEKTYICQIPQTNLVGHGSLDCLSNELNKLNANKFLIVTDKFLASTPSYAKLTKQIKKANKEFVCFDGVIPNPTLECVLSAKKLYLENNCNGIISLGGGSAHDTTKCLALIVNSDKPVIKMQGLNNAKTKTPEFICVNTTAGTGSEVTNVAVITNEKTHFKMTLVDKQMNASISVNDSELMLKLPKSSTAFTGADALVHAIESYMSNIANPMSDSYDIEAIHLIFNNLPIAYNQPENTEARENMAYAELLAGIGFNMTSLGFVHSMSHALSAVYNTPHGLANAMLLPYVLKYELKYPKIVKRLSLIAQTLGINKQNDNENASTFVDKVIELFSTINIPNHLEIKNHEKLTNKEINILSKKAMKDFCGISNPVQFSKKNIKKIYKLALEN